MRRVRHERLRNKLCGTAERPRLAVYRSLRHISAQIIDDERGHTVACASSQEKDLASTGNQKGAEAVGAKLAERAKAQGVSTVVFDRGGFKYHGRVASLAKGARDAGLEF